MARKKKRCSRAFQQVRAQRKQLSAVDTWTQLARESENAWVSSSEDFQRAMAHWQVGDWEELMALSESSQEGSGQRVDIALMIAVAASQLGYSAKSRAYVDKALEWGASRGQVGKALLSGAYNTLGCASSLAGTEYQAKGARYFSESARLALGDGAVPALVKARIREQLDQVQGLQKNRNSPSDGFSFGFQFEQPAGQHETAFGLQRVRELADLTDGYEFNDELGVYQKAGAVAFDNSDGDEVDNRLLTIVRQAEDVSLFSAELRGHQTDWASDYHLSADRASLLRPFSRTLVGSQVLELGSGCGAVTRYLGELGARVTAVEASPCRAAIAAERCRDLPNVQVVLDQPELFCAHRQFDVVIAIGTLEYCPQATKAIDPVQQLLQRAWASLRADGVLIAAIDNQLGLQYFAGAPEAHGQGIMAGIEDRYAASAPRSFGRGELTSRVEKAGFRRTEVYSTFPDIERPALIVAPGAADKAPASWNLATLVNRAMSLSKTWIPRPFLSLGLAGALAAKNKLLADLAGGHLLVGYKSPEGQAGSPGYLASYFSPRSGAASGADSGADINETRFNLESVPEPVSEPGLVVGRQSFQESLVDPDAEQLTRYYSGEVHVDGLHAVIQQPGWTMAQVGQWVALWLRALTRRVVSMDSEEVAEEVTEGGSVTYHGHYRGWLPADYLAASPDHMIRHADGTVRFIHCGGGGGQLVPLARVLYLGLARVFSRLDSVAEPADLQWLDSRHLAWQVLSQLGQAPDERDIPVFESSAMDLPADAASASEGSQFPRLRPRQYRYDGASDCTIYWRGQDEGYSEERSAHHRYNLDGTRHVFTLPLKPDVNDGVIRLRFDVATRPGCFEVQALELLDQDGDVLWQWGHTRNAIKVLEQMELVVDAKASRSCFLSRGSDPQCELKVPMDALKQLTDGSGLRVSLTAWPQEA